MPVHFSLLSLSQWKVGCTMPLFQNWQSSLLAFFLDADFPKNLLPSRKDYWVCRYSLIPDSATTSLHFRCGSPFVTAATYFMACLCDCSHDYFLHISNPDLETALIVKGGTNALLWSSWHICQPIQISCRAYNLVSFCDFTNVMSSYTKDTFCWWSWVWWNLVWLGSIMKETEQMLTKQNKLF